MIACSFTVPSWVWQKSNKHLHCQTRIVRDLKLWENIHPSTPSPNSTSPPVFPSPSLFFVLLPLTSIYLLLMGEKHKIIYNLKGLKQGLYFYFSSILGSNFPPPHPLPGTICPGRVFITKCRQIVLRPK